MRASVYLLESQVPVSEVVAVGLLNMGKWEV